MSNISPQKVLILEDVRSVHNVGSIFRTADAVGVDKIFLVGCTPTPLDRFGRKRNDFQKTALGAEESVPWEYVKDATVLANTLRDEGFILVTLEQGPRAQHYRDYRVSPKTALVVGNEVVGVSEALRARAETLIEIPMRGKKESLNVAVATGIALYALFENARSL